MPKTLARNRDNQKSIYGLVDKHALWLDQALTVDSTPTFSGANITNDLVVGGDLTVNGMTTIINTDILELKDNLIEINSEEVGPGVTSPSGISGLQVNRGASIAYQSVFRESDDTFCIGQAGDLQTVATREDIPLDKGIMIFNNFQKRLDSVTTLPLSITFSSNEVSGNSSTGSVRIQGGLGITGNIRSDASIYVGNNWMRTDTLDLSLNTDYFLNLNVGSGVVIPIDKPINFGNSNNFIKNDSGILRISGNGIINVNSDVSVNLKANSPLIFGPNSEKITFDGTNMVLDSGNSFYINSLAFFTNSSASISSSSGSVKFAGGLSVSNVTDSVSSTNGGSFTSAGGMSIAKKLFVGGTSTFENVSETLSVNVVGGITVGKKLIAGGNYSGNPANNVGIFICGIGNTFTDNATSSSGTVSSVNFNYLGINSIAAVNSNITTNNSSTLFIEGSPVAGTNQTLGNSYALYVNSGISRFNGDTVINSTTADTSLLVQGGVTINKNLKVNRNFDVGSDIQSSPTPGGIFISQTSRTMTDNVTVSGTVSENHFNVLGQPSLSSVSSITTTFSSTLVITGEPLQAGNQTLVNSYSLWIKSGKFRLDSGCDLSGIFNSSNTTESNSIGTGALITLGGASISKNLNVAGVLTAVNTTESTDTDTGSLLILGGFAVKKNVNLGKRLNLGVDQITGTPALGSVLTSGGGSFVDNVTGNSSIGPNFSSNYFKQVTLSGTSTNLTTPQASTVYIEGPVLQGTNQTITENLSFNVNSGNSKFGGNATVTGGFTVQGISSVQRLDIGGPLNMTGANQVNVTVSSNINLTTTGTADINLVSGRSLTANSVDYTVNSGTIQLTATGNSGFTTSSGTLNLNGPTVTIGSTSTEIQPTSTVLGLKLATGISGVPVFIGHSVSETVIGDNLTVTGDLTVQGETTIINSTIITTEDNAVVVNSLPAGISDGGLLVRRYQTPNNTGLGQVVADTPYETGSFQASLQLSLSASSVSNYYRGWWIKFTSGAASGYIRRIKTSDTSRNIVLYVTADNNSNFTDGLDLGQTITSGDTYQLFPGTYAGIFFNDTDNEVSIGNVPYDTGAGVFPLHGYLPLHVGDLKIDTALSLDSRFTIDFTDTTAMVIRKNGDTGNILTVDSQNSILRVGNPVNTVASSSRLDFFGYNNSSQETVYSYLKSEIVVSGTSGKLTLGTLDGGDLIKLGNDVELSVKTRVINSTSSTSTDASLLVTGGITSLISTDATSSSSGGSLTTIGGVAVGKKLYVGGNAFISGGSVSVSPLTTNGQTGLSFYNDTNFSGNVWRIGQNLPTTSVSSFGISYDGTFSLVVSSSGVINLPNTTVSSSTSTGALTISGGVGILLDLNVGGNISGTWNGTVVSVSKGGTGASTLTSTGVLIGNGTSAVSTVSGFTFSSNVLETIKFSVTDATDSTSSTSGSVIISGGVGIAKKLFVGTELNVSGNISFASGDSLICNLSPGNIGSVSITSGSTYDNSVGAGILLKSNDSVSVPGKIVLNCGNVNNSGYLSVITGNVERMAVLYNGTVSFTSADQAISTTVGAVKIAGGLAVVKNVYIGGILNVAGSIQLSTITSGTWNGDVIDVAYGGTGNSTFTSGRLIYGNGTGALQTNSGLSFAGVTLTVPRLSSSDTTQSTSSSTGAITTAGGLGVSKNVHFGEDLFVNGFLGVGTSVNVNSVLTLNSGSNIGVNTVVSFDDGSLSISGGGVGLATRGSLINMYGADHLSQAGNLKLSSGTTAGSLTVNTGNMDRIVVSNSGFTTFSKTGNSSSSTSAPTVFTGGVSISNTTNATSSTNGGALTVAGGAAFGQDLYIGGSLFVTGSVPGAVIIDSPSVSSSNLVNITSTTRENIKNRKTGTERSLSLVVNTIPSAVRSQCSFDITMPEVVTNFVNPYDVICCINGYLADFTPIENCTAFAFTGTTRVRVKFTSGPTTGIHYIQLILNYTLV
jgi:hypothetical protein